MACAETETTQPLSPAVPRPVLRPLRVLLRGSIVMALRRNEIFVLLLLLGLYAVGTLVLRIVGNPSAQGARFALGLGLQLGSVLSAALVIIAAARAIPPEIESRTIYPVLAKPVSRTQLLLGKGLAVWLTGVLALLLFVMASRALAPVLPYQQWRVLLQALVLKSAALLLLTTLGIWLSLLVPLAVNLVLLGGLCFLSGTLVNLLATGSPLVRPLARLVPDFSLFDQFQRFTDGGAPLAWSLFAALLLYATLWCALAACCAARRFSRMPL